MRTSCPRERNVSTVAASVVTTPFVCGAQASVAIAILTRRQQPMPPRSGRSAARRTASATAAALRSCIRPAPSRTRPSRRCCSTAFRRYHAGWRDEYARKRLRHTPPPAHARAEGYDGVVCGHIHRANLRDIDGTLYCNTGDWVESCSALVECMNGELQLLRWPFGVRRTDRSEAALVADAA